MNSPKDIRSIALLNSLNDLGDDSKATDEVSQCMQIKKDGDDKNGIRIEKEVRNKTGKSVFDRLYEQKEMIDVLTIFFLPGDDYSPYYRYCSCKRNGIIAMMNTVKAYIQSILGINITKSGEHHECDDESTMILTFVVDDIVQMCIFDRNFNRNGKQYKKSELPKIVRSKVISCIG